MQPELKFLAGHALAQLARKLIGHTDRVYSPPTRRAKARRPPHEGEVKSACGLSATLHPGVARATPDLPHGEVRKFIGAVEEFAMEAAQNKAFHAPLDFLDSPKSPTKVRAKLGTSRS